MSIRALRMCSSGARHSLSAACHRPAPRAATIQHIRGAASKGEGEKDDLGGPGGQEPADPTARAKQNASLRNKTIAAMILLGGPILYMVSKPKRIAGAQIDNNSAVGANPASNPGEKLQAVQSR